MIAFELHTEAEDELFAAAARYEERVAGLGLDFLSEVDRAMTWVGEHPLASPLWPEVPADLGIRRKLLDRFPFGLPTCGAATSWSSSRLHISAERPGTGWDARPRFAERRALIDAS